ncbi:UTRA domain-containing protein [Caballeronia zhejiangensis]|uniref:UTRA domain-containing protein n=2 Tax=Burkholderiaceae TaxID=119060 RepID=UPI001F5174B3|nr:UTRA domain-containing protein [Caballeronia zhejiangensis]
MRIDGDKDSPPVGWTDVYIDPEYEDVAQAAKENPDTLISALIEARYGRCIDEIQQDVRAIAVSAEMARRLRVEAGTAALEIVRRYLDAGGATFEISVTVHPAERFSVSMRLKRSPGENRRGRAIEVIRRTFSNNAEGGRHGQEQGGYASHEL